MFKEPRGIQPLLHSGSDDLESFLAWPEQIKLDVSESNPLLYQVLGNLAFSKHPIAGGDNFQTNAGQASFSEQRSHQHSGEDRAKEAKELQRQNEGRQLGCLLVQRTKGETQLRVTKWLAATNGWEAWRQVNLTFLSKLLDSLLHMSFDESPASCLQQLSAWKERVVLYQELSGEQLPESIMMSVVMNGLTEKARHLLLLHLDGDSSFGDVEHLLATHLAEQELGEHNRVDDQANTSLQQQEQDKPDQLVKGGQRKGKEKGGAYNPSLQPTEARGSLTSFPTVRTELAEASQKKERARRTLASSESLSTEANKGDRTNKEKEKAKLTIPSLKPTKASGSKNSFLKKQRWCDFCGKRRHTTQACWWNQINQQQQQHQQPARHSLEHQDVQASSQRRQPRVFWIDQPTACASLIPDTLPMLSFEPGTQASTQQACQSSVFMIGQRERLCNAPSLTETWGVEVDLGAATSVAPPGFAHQLELSSAPTTLKLTTATDKEVKIFGLRHVHLQCQDLSLRASFVIADVVTPLLGMDMILQHNLSLIFEHGQSFLVNKAGKRTQLQQKGEQLYLVAGPYQHGLSTSFCGSLSDVIGFLPEDKELHEQTIALLPLQSSSSTDLVEDRSFPESVHVHDKSSFACALCKEKAVVSGGELSHNSLPPLHRQQPKQLSSKEQHPRSSLHRSVELQEAKAQEITHALSTACVYDLPDSCLEGPSLCVQRSSFTEPVFSKGFWPIGDQQAFSSTQNKNLKESSGYWS